MLAVPSDQLPALLATCEGVAGSERVLWIMIPPLVALIWGVSAWACIWRNTGTEERSSLLGLLGLCAATGGLIFLLPEGVSGNGDYLARFFISLFVAAGIGIAWPYLTRQPVHWRSVGVAIAGDVLVPGGLILLFLWALALGGSCID
jgi:hypothetical protein